MVMTRSRAARLMRRVAARLDRPVDEPAPVLDSVASAPLVVHERRSGHRYVEISEVAAEDRRVPPWPTVPPVSYLGQLDAEFQQEQARARATVRVEDCHWYHEVEIGEGARIRGAWDLIDGESAYVGGVSVGGKRVLEIGPASGHVSFWMERQGAEVVTFDAGFDVSIDLLPLGEPDMSGQQRSWMRFIGEVQNAWWWLHRHFVSGVKATYGNIYALPADLGEFDVALIAAVLLHLRDPYRALQQVASHTTGAIVVTDLVPPDLRSDGQVLQFNPASGDRSSWWLISAAAMRAMLATLGFECIEATRHIQYMRLGHDLDADFHPVEFYSLVATRP